MEIPAWITHIPLSHTHCTTLHGHWIFPPFSTPSPIRAHDNTVACVVHSSCNNLSIPCHHNRHTRYPSHVWILWPAPVWQKKLPTSDYSACAAPIAGTGTPLTFSGYLVYALIPQNHFTQRWNENQLAVTPTPSAQINTFLHIPHPIEEAISLRWQGAPSVSKLSKRTDSTPIPTQMTVNLVPTQHTLEEIHQILTSIPASHQCTKVYISHIAMPITMKDIHSIQPIRYSGQHKNESNQTLFRHLRITILTSLIPRDWSLYITIDNIIYALIPTCNTNMATPHRLHLFKNPHNHMIHL